MGLGTKHFLYFFLVSFILISTYYLKPSYYLGSLIEIIRRFSKVFILFSRLYVQGNTAVSLDTVLAYTHFSSYCLRQTPENTGSFRVIEFFPINKSELDPVCHRENTSFL